MIRPSRPARPQSSPGLRTFIAVTGAAVALSIASLAAHQVRGVLNPSLAKALVSSPSANADAPIALAWDDKDTAIRVMCFFTANTSDPRGDDPDWPRITGVGFELPGTLRGFALVDPVDGNWHLVEDRQVHIPTRGTVTVDFAIIAHVNPAGWFRRGPHEPAGIPPGQPDERGTGQRFCVSGPFPPTLPDVANPTGPAVETQIERIINGVVVGFHRVQPHGLSPDIGVWNSTNRRVPLYPE